ncbi:MULTISPECIES: response regulator [unclassified Vibrio]|uniref:Response regulator n=1 Tax=Vibrio sp. HB236076 TaxID=3232307 RepID=A0AB39HHC0_9VIBR|nr:response regulator [Vibrio sp. HB161653]MDP5254738.1 response regulator [Vibrio sp. HB161653]
MNKMVSAKVDANNNCQPEKAYQIMIVDDDPVFRRITSAFLTRNGYRVSEAENGIDALKALRTQVPDLLLCDLDMPFLNGIELVEELTQQYPSLPLMVISSTSDMKEVANAIRLGIKEFVAKPVADYQQLLGSIEAVIDKSHDVYTQQQAFGAHFFPPETSEERVTEEQELHWHLNQLQENPAQARDLLRALLPEQDSSQGNWHCSYRLLQTTETMPFVFDYRWLMQGQFAFYLLDSDTEQDHGVVSALLIRTLFDDYLRKAYLGTVVLKDLVRQVEAGIASYRYAPPIKAMFGLADFTTGSIRFLPAGLSALWDCGSERHVLRCCGILGGETAPTLDEIELPIGHLGQLMMGATGKSNFDFTLRSRRV